MKKILTTAALTLVLIGGGTTTASALHKDVQLTVDGQPVPGSTFAVTVADVLNGNGIALSTGDVVTPSIDAKIEDGQTVTVQYAKTLTLSVDGKSETFSTLAPTLRAAIADRNIAGLDQAWTSVGLDAPLPRGADTASISTAKPIQLSVAGKATTVVSNANTVGDLLSQKGLSADSDDIISPANETVLTNGAQVRLDRVEITTKQVTEEVKAPVTKTKSSTLWLGESKTLVAGKNGRADRTYQITTVNGKVTKQVILTEKVLLAAKASTIQVGTKTSANGVGINLARAAMWDKIAKCESGGNWSINTGNGYYGGLQFNLSAWNSNGGRDFAAYPHKASRAQQITVANRYYAKAGTSPWSCA